MRPLTLLEASLPGAELVAEGLADLAAGRETELGLLLHIAAPRLRSLGVPIPDRPTPTSMAWEHRLYDRLEMRLGPGAHSYYNSLVRRIVSFAHALEREQKPGPLPAVDAETAITPK